MLYRIMVSYYDWLNVPLHYRQRINGVVFLKNEDKRKTNINLSFSLPGG